VNEATYTLLGMGVGTILGAGIAIINTCLTNRTNIKLAKMKMHEGVRIEAYKNLLAFSESILGSCTPDDDMWREFLRVMKTQFYQKIFPNYLYYSKKIRYLLSELKSQNDCWGHPDFFDEEEANNFLRNRLRPLTRELQNLTIEEVDV